MAGILSLPLTGVISGVSEQNYINAALASLVTAQASASAPTATTLGLATMAGVWWHNTSTGVISVRNQADTAWIPLGTINESTNVFTPAGVSLTSASIITALGYTPMGGANRQVFLSSGTWTKPAAGGTLAIIEVWGAGCGGDYSGGQAGFGGGYTVIICLLSDLTATVAVTIGAGGAAGSASAGGATSFGGYLTQSGGAQPTSIGHLIAASGLTFLSGSSDAPGGSYSGQNGQSTYGSGSMPSLFGGAGGAATGTFGTAGAQPGGGGGMGLSGASAGGAGKIAVTVL